EPPDPSVGGQPCSPSFGRLRLGPRYFPGAEPPDPSVGGQLCSPSFGRLRLGPRYFPGAEPPDPSVGGQLCSPSFGRLRLGPRYFPGADPPDPPVGGQPCAPSFGRLRLGPRNFPGARAPGPPRGRLRSAFSFLGSLGYRPGSVPLSGVALVLGGGQAEVGTAGLARLVDQAVRGHDQVLPQLGVVRRIESHLVQGRAHVTQPGVPFRLPDDEARVS